MASADDMEGVMLRSGLTGCAMTVDDGDRATLWDWQRRRGCDTEWLRNTN